MELFSSLIRSSNQRSHIAPVTPGHVGLSMVSGSNAEPECYNSVEADDIFSQLEACRKSAARNLESYLRGMEYLLTSDGEASDTNTVIAKDSWTKQHWRLKIDKDDLRRDLIEMKMILNFLINRSTNSKSYIRWILPVLPILNFPFIMLEGTSYALGKIHGTRFQDSIVWMFGLLPIFNEYLMAKQCRRAVQQVLNDLVNETLDKKDADALNGQEFRALRRFGIR